MPSGRRTLTTIAATVAAVLSSAGPCLALDRGGENYDPVKGNKNGVQIDLSTTTHTKIVRGAGNTGEPAFQTPPCWYQPIGDSAAFQTVLDELKRGAHGSDDNQEWTAFLAWLGPWENQLAGHEGDKPQGTWYQAMCTDWSTPQAIAWGSANPDFIYVQPNTKPKGVILINPVTLAQYAVKSAWLLPPDPTFSPDAANPSDVNLTTWAWQTTDGPKDLKAQLKGTAIAATAVMTPTSMTLTTDGPTASDIPNTCKLTADGTIGVKWTPGDVDPSGPGCGLKFTKPGTYVVHADVDWTVTWTSPQDPGVHTLPDIHMHADTTITAREIETTNSVPMQRHFARVGAGE